ncbi:putative 3-beta-hydroxysteroid-Delta(8),Delta(7)-isomerase [Iris pallida]|uniref:3-beta-hydroxysteroid-Delta(8),Delta(7)-isomerase n=1 Tax=Iris pallida TaxID=29817 RepID=A0AAX6HNT5_IRIPA|nr:putative 3-beta-hydroxysteroid-Delta(8),Delta(7)-isomerase [Iris pallida]
MAMSSDHPYIPRDLHLPGYIPISLSQSDILVPYLGSSLLVVAIVGLVSGRFPKISKTDRWLMCWWAFTGLTHIILEGYFAFTPDFYMKTPYLAELWKEYGKGDSRYVGRDAAIVTVEGITAAIEGPACLLAVYAIASRKPYSCTLQLAISLGQLYGCLVYFITAFLLGDNFSIGPLYYWAYYVFANSIWILIPSLILVRSWKKISAALTAEKSKTQ